MWTVREVRRSIKPMRGSTGRRWVRWWGAVLWLAWGCAWPVIPPPGDPYRRLEVGVGGGASGVYTTHVYIAPAGCAGEPEILREQRQWASGEVWGHVWGSVGERHAAAWSWGLGWEGVWRDVYGTVRATFWEYRPYLRSGVVVFLADTGAPGGLWMEVGIRVFSNMRTHGNRPSYGVLAPVRPLLGVDHVYAALIPVIPVGKRVEIYPLILPVPGFGTVVWKHGTHRFYVSLHPPPYGGTVMGPDNAPESWMDHLWKGWVSVGASLTLDR